MICDSLKYIMVNSMLIVKISMGSVKMGLGITNSLPARSDFCRLLLITFAKSLDAYQIRPNIGTDLDPNHLAPWWYSWKNFSKKFDFEKNQHKKIMKHAELRIKWNILWESRSACIFIHCDDGIIVFQS